MGSTSSATTGSSTRGASVGGASATTGSSDTWEIPTSVMLSSISVILPSMSVINVGKSVAVAEMKSEGTFAEPRRVVVIVVAVVVEDVVVDVGPTDGGRVGGSVALTPESSDSSNVGDSVASVVRREGPTAATVSTATRQTAKSVDGRRYRYYL